MIRHTPESPDMTRVKECESPTHLAMESCMRRRAAVALKQSNATPRIPSGKPEKIRCSRLVPVYES
jgi:hypothetical protein